MPHFRKTRGRRSAHSLGRGIRGHQLRVPFLQEAQFPQQAIVFCIRDGRAVACGYDDGADTLQVILTRTPTSDWEKIPLAGPR